MKRSQTDKSSGRRSTLPSLFELRLDSFARLLQCESTCVGLVPFYDHLLIASNGNRSIEQIKDILQYFIKISQDVDYLNYEERLATLTKICLYQTRAIGGRAGNIHVPEDVVAQVVRDRGIRLFPPKIERQKSDAIGIAIGVFEKVNSDFEEVEKFLRRQSRAFFTGDVSDLTRKLDLFVQCLTNYKIVYLEQEVHVEIGLLAEMVRKKYSDAILSRSQPKYSGYIGISKLRCLKCHIMIDKANEVLRSRGIDFSLTTRGEHDLYFENWQLPSIFEGGAIHVGELPEDKRNDVAFLIGLETQQEINCLDDAKDEEFRPDKRARTKKDAKDKGQGQKKANWVDQCPTPSPTSSAGDSLTKERIDDYKNAIKMNAMIGVVLLKSRTFKSLFEYIDEGTDPAYLISKFFDELKFYAQINTHDLLRFLQSNLLAGREIASYFQKISTDDLVAIDGADSPPRSPRTSSGFSPRARSAEAGGPAVIGYKPLGTPPSRCRRGLFKAEDRNAPRASHLLYEVLITTGFGIGDSYSGGDCFFDSCALALTAAKGEQYIFDGLRKLCSDYVKNLDKDHPTPKKADAPKTPRENWIYWLLYQKALSDRQSAGVDISDKVVQAEAADKYNQYLMRIQFTAEEAKRLKKQKLGSGIAEWGEQEVDGRILCHELGVRIHVIEVNEALFDHPDIDSPILHQIIDAEGVHPREDPSELYRDPNVIHIAAYRNHFAPILRGVPLQLWEGQILVQPSSPPPTSETADKVVEEEGYGERPQPMPQDGDPYDSEEEVYDYNEVGDGDKADQSGSDAEEEPYDAEAGESAAPQGAPPADKDSYSVGGRYTVFGSSHEQPERAGSPDPEAIGKSLADSPELPPVSPLTPPK